MALMDKLHGWWERGYPWAAGIFCAALAHWVLTAPTADKSGSLLAASVSVASILMGFLGTAKTILLTLQSKKFGWLKANKVGWGRLMSYIKSAVLANFVLCVASLAALPLEICPAAMSWIFPAWAFQSAFALFTFYRVLSLILTLVSSEGQ